MPEPKRKSSRRFQVHVDEALCDGCAICVFFCKPVVFDMSASINRRGVYPSLPARSEACNNCRLCELGCPQLAIYVEPLPEEGA